MSCAVKLGLQGDLNSGGLHVGPAESWPCGTQLLHTSGSEWCGPLHGRHVRYLTVEKDFLQPDLPTFSPLTDCICC